jgi:hypothetical protein
MDISKANKIAIETSKTGKVTAVVAILKVLEINLTIHGTLIRKNC